MPASHTKTTTDLVVHHSARKLAATQRRAHFAAASAPVFFGLAGLATLGLSLVIVRDATSSIVASEIVQVAAPEMHAAAGDLALVQEKMHAAAAARAYSQQFMMLGLLLIAATSVWAAQQFGWWHAPAQFRVRKIGK